MALSSIRLHAFKPRLIAACRGYDRRTLMADLGAGVTVGIIALPLAMAFAIASGLKPEQGLITAVIAGFLVAALGGSNVQVAGPAGAFIVIVYGIVERYGLANLLIATILSGVLLFTLGLLRLGSMVRYIPIAIVIGFTNGIAVLIALSQIKDLLGLRIDKLPSDFFEQLTTLIRHASTFNPHALAIGLLTLGCLFLWPRLFKGQYQLPSRVIGNAAGQTVSRLPSPIVALVTMTVATAWLQLPVETIGTRFGGIPDHLPSMAMPDFTWATAKLLFIPTLTLTMLGAIESLLCARIADNMSDLPRHDPNQELMAQGIANVVTPFFGGMPATGTIARTSTNVRSGARTPVAGIVHAVTILAVMLLAAPLAMHVPLAALAGILLYVAWNMGEWREFAHLRHFAVNYRVLLIGTFLLTVIFDLMVAVEVGLVLACVFFVYRMNRMFQVKWLEDSPSGIAAAQLYGTLFFGAVVRIEHLSAGLPVGTRVLALELHRLIFIDTSGVDALRQLRRDLHRQGVDLILSDANAQPLSILKRSGLASELGEHHIFDSLAEAFAYWAPAAASKAP